MLTINECIGDENKGFINYAGLVEDVKEGDNILIDDGLIELKVESVSGADINCIVVNGGELGEKKGINVPGVKIKLPALTDKDKEDIRFGIKTSFDFIAASFVRNAQCIKEIKDILKEAGSRIQVIAKIENAEGIENIDFNNLISMNDTAAYIWKNVQGKDFSVEDMVSMILSEYDIDEATAKNDCKALAENWLNAGICEE